MSLVYMATNVVNGHRYVGYTSRSLKDRMVEHFRFSSLKESSRRMSIFSNAIRKYGKNNFSFEVVKSDLSETDGLRFEAELISKLKPEYNVAPGGKVFHGPWTRERKLSVSKKVICLDDGNIYESLLAASAHYGIRSPSLCSVLRGRRTSIKGLHFSYYHPGLSDEQRLSLLHKKEILRQFAAALNGGR